MSEGPQVLLKVGHLNRWLGGKVVLEAGSPNGKLPDASRLSGRRFEHAECKGKHIFLRFGNGVNIHNHLLMRGAWRRLSGRLLFPPQGTWLSLYVTDQTVVNTGGQMMEWVDDAGVAAIKASLGPDVMSQPFPADAIRASLFRSALPVGEALNDQSVVCGLGNVARAEALFLARVSPAVPSHTLTSGAMDRLLDAIRSVMTDSLVKGGRWTHRVYQNAGRPCITCGTNIRVLKLPPSRRSLFYCPRCQTV